MQANAQEEKLAHDLYAEFAARYDDPVFDRIAASETRHLEAFRTLFARYDITDPTAGQASGSFNDPTVKATYDRLLAEGLTGEPAAFGVGRTVETTDIADLRAAAEGLTAPDVQQVYQQLLNASAAAPGRVRVPALTQAMGGLCPRSPGRRTRAG